MQIINILLIEKGIPTNMQSFAVYEEQDMSLVREQAINYLRALVILKNKDISEEELEEIDFVYVHKDFEVHLINSFV